MIDCHRALRSPVMAMARPRRPVAEIAAVQEAAAAIREETGITSAQGLGRKVARRVIDLLLDDKRNESASNLPSMAMDPIYMLAYGEGFGAVDDLAARYRDRLLANFGAAIVVEFQQRIQRKNVAIEICTTLSRRYASHIGNSTLLAAKHDNSTRKDS